MPESYTSRRRRSRTRRWMVVFVLMVAAGVVFRLALGDRSFVPSFHQASVDCGYYTDTKTQDAYKLVAHTAMFREQFWGTWAGMSTTVRLSGLRAYLLEWPARTRGEAALVKRGEFAKLYSELGYPEAIEVFDEALASPDGSASAVIWMRWRFLGAIAYGLSPYMAGCGILGFALCVWIARRQRAIAMRGHCQNCGYDRVGLEYWRVCPECGVMPLSR